MNRVWGGRLVGAGIVCGSYFFHLWNGEILADVSILNLIEGIVLGILLFGISFALTSQGQAFDLSCLIRKKIWVAKDFWKGVWIYGVLTALWEEWVWRVSLQSIFLLFFGNFLSIMVTAVLFTLSHVHRFQGRAIRIIEFFVFSILLSLIFAITHHYWIVVLIHFIRNVLTVFFRFNLLEKEASLFLFP